MHRLAGFCFFMESRGDFMERENPSPQPGNANEWSVRAETYDWLEAVVFSIAVVVMIFTFFFRIVGVQGPSMENTLQNGDRVIISILDYHPKTGDIVVLNTPAVPTSPIIKRIIAVGGQTVNINYQTGAVYVDGKLRQEKYIRETTTFEGEDPVPMPVKVPKGSVFVMGDNRNNSFDSRSSAIGNVDMRNIMGHAVLRIFPTRSAGVLK